MLLGSLLGVASASENESLRASIEREFRSGQVVSAMQRIERAVAARPDDAALRFLHGVMLSESGRAVQAAQAFERMTQEFPELPEPYNNLAVLHAAQSRWDKARELLETAVRIDPGYRAAQRNLGDVLARLALRAYEAAAPTPDADAALARRIGLARELAGVAAAP